MVICGSLQWLWCCILALHQVCDNRVWRDRRRCAMASTIVCSVVFLFSKRVLRLRWILHFCSSIQFIVTDRSGFFILCRNQGCWSHALLYCNLSDYIISFRISCLYSKHICLILFVCARHRCSTLFYFLFDHRLFDLVRFLVRHPCLILV